MYPLCWGHGFFIWTQDERCFPVTLQNHPPPAQCSEKLNYIKGLLHPPLGFSQWGQQPEVRRWEDGQVREFILLLPWVPDQHSLSPLTEAHSFDQAASLHSSLWFWVPVIAPSPPLFRPPGPTHNRYELWGAVPSIPLYPTHAFINRPFIKLSSNKPDLCSC